jgi:hypothetical protein
MPEPIKQTFNKTATQTQQLCGKCRAPYVKGFCGCERIVVIKRRSVGI